MPAATITDPPQGGSPLSTTIAYALRAEFEGTVTQTVDGEDHEVPVFSGGMVAAGDRDVDIAELLDEGSGRIAVEESDIALVTALDAYPALKRVGSDETDTPANPYAAHPAAQLRAEAKRRGLHVPKAIKHDALADALLEHDRELAAAHQEAAATDTHDVTVTPDGGLDTDDEPETTA